MKYSLVIWLAIFWVSGGIAADRLELSSPMTLAIASMLILISIFMSKKVGWRLTVVCVIGFLVAYGQRYLVERHNATQLIELAQLAWDHKKGEQLKIPVNVEGVIAGPLKIDGDRVTLRIQAEQLSIAADPSWKMKNEQGAAETEDNYLDKHLQQLIKLSKQDSLLTKKELIQVGIRLDKQEEQLMAEQLSRGEHIKLVGMLFLPMPATNIGGFDYRRYLHTQKIHWQLEVEGLERAMGTVKKVQSPLFLLQGDWWLNKTERLRRQLATRMEQLYPSPHDGYMKGLVLGLASNLEPEQYRQFSRIGLTHILAISGLHVAVILSALGMIMRLCNVSKERMLIVLICCVPLYVLLTGASPSAIRAGIMAVLGLVAVRLGRLKNGLHLISIAAIVMLLVNPYFLENISFQFSFLVTLGLILGVPPLRSLLPDWRRGRMLLDVFAVTIVAQLVSFPLSIYYFNQFNLLSLLANIVLVPLIGSIIMPLGCLSLLCALIYLPLGQLLARLIIWLNEWIFACINWLNQADWARLIFARPSMWWVCVWLLCLLGLFIWMKRVVRGKAVLASMPSAKANYSKFIWFALVLVSLFLVAYYKELWSNNGYVSILDVGQGDAIHVRTPTGKHLLIDGGGSISYKQETWRQRREPYDVGRKVLVPLLLARGVQEIDVLVLSHLDHDHIRGLQAVLETIPIKEIWWNGTLKDAKDAEELLRTAANMRIPMYSPTAGDYKIVDSSTAIHILWPNPQEAGAEILPVRKDQNEHGVVLMLAMQGKTFLLPGDIGIEEEAGIMRQGGLNELADAINLEGIDVLKLAHHGSRYSSSEAWLSYVRPVAAVASAGRGNSYNHPHPLVLERLNKQRIALWRTDWQGEIRFVIQKNDLFVQTGLLP